MFLCFNIQSTKVPSEHTEVRCIYPRILDDAQDTNVRLTSTAYSYRSGNRKQNKEHGVRVGMKGMDRGKFPSYLGVTKHDR